MKFIKKIKEMLNKEVSSETAKSNFSKVEKEEYLKELEENLKESVFNLPDVEKEIEQPDYTQETEDLRRVEIAPDFNQFTIKAIKSRLALLHGSTANLRVDEIRFYFERKDVLYLMASEENGALQQPEFKSEMVNVLKGYGVKVPNHLNIVIEVSPGKVELYTLICKGVSMQMIDYNSQVKSENHLILKLTAKGGTLEQSEYNLKLRKQPYHAGKGKNVLLRNNIPHCNDIVFINPKDVENPTDDILNNKVISRLQFSIYSAKDHFYIKRIGLGFNPKSRVDIQRNDNGIYRDLPLNTEETQLTLNDGDIILINKKVSIIVELIKEGE